MTDNENHKTAGFRPELFAIAAEKAKGDKKLPPVHLWNPDFCGDIDMCINRDGSWDYMGTPISRQRMVKLFSTILRQDKDQYYLVTPVEKVGIKVVDAPFVAVEMEVEDKQILFRTNLDDYVNVGKENPIRVSINNQTGEPSPYVLVRDRLEALISRNVYYQLVDIAVENNGEYGVWSGGEFFPLS
ncbi:MAG: DUF1285 domain-containing protein [Kordiimonadaceae bacterium]|jgi:uncharacterized protein|nr:DUF1285 domain-containing protein [Kordiimonadaceae bacterium]MBT6031732.1 DUF1285 domain-containing protein [Kordiimonadaceae bacterium]